MILYFITLGVCGGVAFIIQNNNAHILKNILLCIFFKCVYLYSKCQLSLIKLNDTCIELIKSNSFLSNLLNINKNNYNIFIQSVKNGQVYEDIVDCCDFVVINKMMDGCLNKKIVNNVLSNRVNTTNYDNITFENSNLQFLLVEFKINDGPSYKINLKNNTFNYYIVGNKLSKQFFIYYLKHSLKITEPINDTDRCQLYIIDNDVNTFNIDLTDNTEVLLIEKNTYKVLITLDDDTDIKYDIDDDDDDDADDDEKSDDENNDDDENDDEKSDDENDDNADDECSDETADKFVECDVNDDGQ